VVDVSGAATVAAGEVSVDASATVVAGVAAFDGVTVCAAVLCVDPVSWPSQTAPPMTAAVMIAIAMPKWFTEASCRK